jgi:hypothetical protein
MHLPADQLTPGTSAIHPTLRAALRSPRQRRPTGAAPPLPYRLQTSGVGWLVAAVVLVGLTLAVFAHGLRGPAVPVTVLDDAVVRWLAGLQVPGLHAFPRDLVRGSSWWVLFMLSFGVAAGPDSAAALAAPDRLVGRLEPRQRAAGVRRSTCPPSWRSAPPCPRRRCRRAAPSTPPPRPTSTPSPSCCMASWPTRVCGCRPSLAGLRRGAVLCVRGLDDASALDGMRAAEGHLSSRPGRIGSSNAPSGSHTPSRKEKGVRDANERQRGWHSPQDDPGCVG